MSKPKPPADAVPPADATIVAVEPTFTTRGPGSGARSGEPLIGAVLNSIYSVTRFVARGGMGDVYEGLNIESDERVAIKVMRAHLAEDPKALAMFRKEARILTHFAHPAIVQYRVLARDPVFDIYYIVTDYIDGAPLSEILKGVRPSVAEIVALARRLAEGLLAAHNHGAIHRDMSPDNVLLPGGVIEHATIIDFGIAKSLDASVETVIGDGFAGKLGYVAPEQFGDFDRSIGPWTDIYSTALVILAFARGIAPDMGSTLSVAVERRHSQPQLSDLPPALIPMLSGMLVPDPAVRIRSMADVIAMLDAVDVTEPIAAPVAPQAPEPTTIAPARVFSGLKLTTFTTALPASAELADASAEPAGVAATGRRSKRGWLLLLAALLSAGIVAVVTLLLPEKSELPASPLAGPAEPLPTATASTLAAAPVTETACSWPARNLAFERNEIIPAANCAKIDTFRQFRTRAGTEVIWMATERPRLERNTGLPGCPSSGAFAQFAVSINAPDPAKSFSLIAVLPSGQLRQIASGPQQLDLFAASYPRLFQKPSPGHYRVAVCLADLGVVGILLVEGQGPFDLGLRNGAAVSAPADFLDRFRTTAQVQGWTTQMAWFQIVDELPNTPVATLGTTPAAPIPQVAPALAPVTEPAVATTGTPAPSGVTITSDTTATESGVCRRQTGSTWEEFGVLDRSACLTRIFDKHCEPVSGEFGKFKLRSADGKIKIRGERYWFWTKIGNVQCVAG